MVAAVVFMAEEVVASMAEEVGSEDLTGDLSAATTAAMVVITVADTGMAAGALGDRAARLVGCEAGSSSMRGSAASDHGRLSEAAGFATVRPDGIPFKGEAT